MAELPKEFEKYRAAAGAFRKFDKVLLYGEDKSGKSRLSSGFPGPIFAIDTGEAGIEYCVPETGGNLVLHCTDPFEVARLFAWGCERARAGEFTTLILDSGTVFWDRTKEAGYDKIAKKNNVTREAVQAQYQDWGWIKVPMQKVLADAMAVPANVVITAWLNDLGMESAEPGAKAQVLKRQVPDIEKKFPYLFDYTFFTEKLKDTRGVPTGQFRVTFIGGRVPPTVPPGALYPGRTWTFDARTAESLLTPTEVYEDVIGWLRPYKEGTGARADFLIVGHDAEEVQAADRALGAAVEDEALGALVRLLEEIKSAQDFTLKQTKILQATMKLSKDQKRTAGKIIDARKLELGMRL